jgi:hypothetical protein
MSIVDEQHRDDVLLNIVKNVQANGNCFTTGDVGSRYLFQALARNGYNDVMYAMLNRDDMPSCGFQEKYELTTLTEQWNPREGNSWNHFMPAQIVEWFYRTLAGIALDDEQPGFSHFYIAPTPVGDLTYVNASHTTIYGKIKVSWKSENGAFTLKVAVPVNAAATVVLPYADEAEITLDGTPLPQAKNATVIENSKVLIGSGEYTFRYSEK